MSEKPLGSATDASIPTLADRAQCALKSLAEGSDMIGALWGAGVTIEELLKACVSAVPAATEPPQDWKDIFEVYREQGCSDAWLYRQIEAHSLRASRPSASANGIPACSVCGVHRVACGENTACPGRMPR